MRGEKARIVVQYHYILAHGKSPLERRWKDSKRLAKQSRYDCGFKIKIGEHSPHSIPKRDLERPNFEQVVLWRIIQEYERRTKDMIVNAKSKMTFESNWGDNSQVASDSQDSKRFSQHLSYTRLGGSL